eukprot:9480040-Pyramimonas_sp.AAC.1
MEDSAHLATDAGERYDILRTSPFQLQKLVEAAAVRASDRMALRRIGATTAVAHGFGDAGGNAHPPVYAPCEQASAT